MSSDDETGVVCWDEEDTHDQTDPPVFLEQLDVGEIQVGECGDGWNSMMSNHSQACHKICWPSFNQLWVDHWPESDPEDWHDDKVETGGHF